MWQHLNCLRRSVPEIHYHVAGTLSNQATNQQTNITVQRKKSLTPAYLKWRPLWLPLSSEARPAHSGLTPHQMDHPLPGPRPQEMDHLFPCHLCPVSKAHLDPCLRKWTTSSLAIPVQSVRHTWTHASGNGPPLPLPSLSSQ